MSDIDRLYEPVSVFSLPRSGTPGCVQLVAFSPGGTFLAGAIGNTIRVWSTNDSEHHIFDYRAWRNMQIASVLWNNEGLHCGYSDGGYCVIDFDESTWRFCVSGFWMGSSAIQFLAQQTGKEKLLAVASKDAVSLWRRKPAKSAANCAISLPGAHFPMSAYKRLFSNLLLTPLLGEDWYQVQALPRPPAIHSHSDQVEVTGISWRVSNPQHLAICYLNHGVIIWDSQTGRQVQKIIRMPLRSISGSFSPTSSHLAVLTEFNTIDIYDVDSQSFLQTLPENFLQQNIGKSKRSVAYSHNGCYLLAAGPESMRIWHTDSALGPQHLKYDGFDVPAVHSIEHVATYQSNAKNGEHGVATILNNRFIALHAGGHIGTRFEGHSLSLNNRHETHKLTSLFFACTLIVGVASGLYIGRSMSSL